MRILKYMLLGLLLFASNGFSDDLLLGVWKHTQKPAWLEVTFESGVGSLTVLRHDDNKGAEGLNVIRSIVPDSSGASEWSGEMYSAAADDYVAVTLILVKPKTIAVFEGSDSKRSQELLRFAKQ